MQSTDSPTKLTMPWAVSGGRTSIPVTSQIGITDGAASLPDGFPLLNRLPPTSGGIPVNGLEMNGIIYLISAGIWWLQGGGNAKWDSAFSAAVGGYALGAVVQSLDGVGYWRSLAENNTTNPDTGGANWAPHFGYGQLSQSLTNVNVSLTSAQALRPQIVLSGTLTANINLVFPTNYQEWLVVNNCGGAFSITAKTVGGTGVVLGSGENLIYGDGINIASMLASFTPLSSFSHSSFGVLTVGSSAAATGSVGSSGWERAPNGKHRQWTTMQILDDDGSTPIVWTLPNSTLFTTGVISMKSSNLAHMNAGSISAQRVGMASLGAFTATSVTIYGANTYASGTKFWSYIEVEGF